MKKKSMKYTLILTVLTLTVLNMAHPVTPMFIRETGMPSYMFGVLFAAMSVGNLLFSPLWGRLSDNNGRIIFLILGILGYGLSQLGFGFSTKPIVIIVYRFLGGAFVTSFLTVIIAYISDLTDEDNRLKGLSYYAAASTIGSSLGSLLGGFIGNSNYKITFVTQFILAVIICFLIYIMLGETVDRNRQVGKISSSKISKKNSSIKIKGVILFVMIQVALFYFASTSYNSSVNFFIESVLNMPPSVNGLFLSVAGICGFIANLIFTPFLGKRFGLLRTYEGVSIIIAICIGLVGISRSNLFFFFGALLFVATASVYVPIQQNIVTNLSEGNNGEIVGIQNSAKAVGMILGSLYSGFIFDVNSKLPFITAAIILLFAYIYLTINGKKYLKVIN